MPSNFTFNPTTWDNGINLVKGPPVADLALPPKQPTVQDVLQEWGGTGTIIVGGILSSQDYNPELSGVQRVDVYDQMRKGDATVRAALQAVKLPIMAANWYMKSFKNGNSKHDQIKDFVEDNRLNMDLTWTDWMRHCLNYLDYGSMAFEKVYQMGDDGKIHWQKFAPRLSKTIYRWRMPDNVTTGITQILPTGGIRGIPSWKLLMFINEQEGENYEGLSLLRFAYTPWYFKNALYKISAIAAERQGVGIPYVKIPPNANEQDRAKVDELLANMRANEMAHVEIPVGWEIGFLDTHGSALKNMKDDILHHDRQISKSVLAQFLELGGTANGSFALSANQSELFLLSLKAIATKIQEVINNSAIKELVDLNFKIPPKQYPKLEFGRIGTVDFEKFSIALFRLAQGGLISASPELEEYIHNVMDLPEAVQESQNEGEDPETNTLPVPQKVQKVEKPVQVYSKEMDRMEHKYASELQDIRKQIGYDVRELRREVEAIIQGKY